MRTDYVLMAGQWIGDTAAGEYEITYTLYAIEHECSVGDVFIHIDVILRWLVDTYLDTPEGQAFAHEESPFGHFAWHHALDHIPDEFWRQHQVLSVRRIGDPPVLDAEEELYPFTPVVLEGDDDE